MKRTLILLTLSASTLVVSGFTGCQNQQQTAATLVATLGADVANLAAIEGKSPELVSKIKADTAAAAQQVAAFQPGSPTQNVITALTLVEDDLSLFPVDAQDQALIELSLTTVQTVIALIPAPATIQSAVVGDGRPVTLTAHRVVAMAPAMSAKDFKAKWNAMLATRPALAAATTK